MLVAVEAERAEAQCNRTRWRASEQMLNEVDAEHMAIPMTIAATPTAIAPVVRKRPEEYFVTNCSMSVGFGGKNSNAGACCVKQPAARLNAGDSEASAGRITLNSSGA